MFWSKISVFVLGLTGSVAARVLTSLGIGFVAYETLNTIASNLVDHAQTNYNSIGGVVLQILNLSGGGTAMNVLTSAMITKAALMAAKALRPL